MKKLTQLYDSFQVFTLNRNQMKRYGFIPFTVATLDWKTFSAQLD